MVDETLIQELQKIIKQDCEKDLTPQETAQIANTLVGYFDLLAKIYHRIQTNE